MHREHIHSACQHRGVSLSRSLLFPWHWTCWGVSPLSTKPSQQRIPSRLHVLAITATCFQLRPFFVTLRISIPYIHSKDLFSASHSHSTMKLVTHSCSERVVSSHKLETDTCHLGPTTLPHFPPLRAMDPAAMRAARRAERIARITASGSKGSGLLASTPSRARAVRIPFRLSPFSPHEHSRALLAAKIEKSCAHHPPLPFQALREVNTTPGPSAPKGDIGVASATAATSSSANPPSPPFVPPPPQFEEEEAQQAVTPAHAAARPMTDPMPTPSASVFSAIDAMLSDDDEDDDGGSSATAPPPPLPSLSATANKPAPPSVAPRRPAPPVPPTSTSVVAKATKDAPTRGGGSSNSSRVAVSSSTSSAENGKDRASAHVATSSPNPAASNTLLVRQAAPPPPPPLAMLRQSTVTELLPPLAKASDAVAVRRSSVKRTAPSDAADNEDSTPVMETPKPPPRRAKRSRSQRTTAALAAASATQWAAAGTDASGVGSASMDIDSKPAGSHSSTVTAGINTVVLAGGGGGSAGQRKRSPAEEISLQRQLCVKAAEMAALLARSGDHDMAIEAAKTSVIESLRLEVLETDVTTSVTAPSAGLYPLYSSVHASRHHHHFFLFILSLLLHDQHLLY